MPDLLTSLQKRDLGHLRIVAELWGLELDSNEANLAAEELSGALLDLELVAELMDSLSPEARTALNALADKEGRLPWAEFTRRFGQIREMGAGKRDREQPHLHPNSTAEILFYRALVARAFFDTDKGPQEFAYVPEDLLELIISHRGAESQRENKKQSSQISDSVAINNEPLGRPASPGEHGQEFLTDNSILDDATTYLAALRSNLTPPETKIPNQVIEEFLQAAKLIKKGKPQPEPVKAFLEAPRGEALKMLSDAWMESEIFNELRQLPGLVFEGEWKNQPLVTREFLLNLFEPIPEGKWWSLPAFLRAVKEKYPDYQRPAGDYDSWFIKRESDGQYLRGFAHWDSIDGALIKYFVTKILFWLGLADLATAKANDVITSFRLTSFVEKKEESGKIAVSSNGKISIPRLAPRVVRYQVSRFCEWDEPKADEYLYFVTAASLTRSKEQGLKAEQLLALLAKHSSAGVPPSLVKALKRWEINGTEARMQSQIVLRVSKPEALEEMRKSKAARFMGESLGPTTVVIKEGAQSKVLAALAELGLLADDESAKNTNSHE